MTIYFENFKLHIIYVFNTHVKFCVNHISFTIQSINFFI